MNINDFICPVIKQVLKANQVYLHRYNGYFIVTIQGVIGKNYKITGIYNHEGRVLKMRFGYLSRRFGILLPPTNLADLLKTILHVIKITEDTK